jgi:site-specific recombinase XerD
LLEEGVALCTIQSLLGHSSILSTMRYLQVTHKLYERTPSPLHLLESPAASRATSPV